MSSTKRSSGPRDLRSRRWGDQGRKKKTISFYFLKSFVKTDKDLALNEIRITQNLRHQNVLPLQNWYETKNHFWTIYEYLAGETLADILRFESSVGEDFLRQILEMLLSGLHYLHSKRIAVFNFSPGVLAFDEYNILRFANLCEARMFGDDYSLPQDLSYVAPELATGKAKPAVASDMWGLGCLVYHLATGQLPFDLRDSYMGTAERFQYDDKKLEKFTPEFKQLLRGLLKFKPEERFSWNDILSARWTQGFKIKGPESEGQKKLTEVDFLEPLTLQDLVVEVEGATENAEARKQSAEPPKDYEHSNLESFDSQSLSIQDLSADFMDVYDTNPIETIASGMEPVSSTSIGDHRLSKTEAARPTGAHKTMPTMRTEEPAPLLVQNNRLTNTQVVLPQVATLALPSEKNKVQRGPSEATAPLKQSPSRNATETQSPRITQSALPFAFAEPGSTRTTFNEPTSEYKSKPQVITFELERLRDSEETNKYARFKREALARLTKRFPETLKRVSEVTVLFHERIATPIVGNDRIEQIERPTFASNATDLHLPDVHSFNEEQTKKYLTLVYKYLVGETQVNKVLPVFYYLIDICAAPEIANFIMESQLIGLFCKMLGELKLRLAKVAVCTLIAMVFRNATVVSCDIQEDTIARLLLSLLDDIDARVSQRSSAALGEVLYYSSSKSTEQNQAWPISEHVLAGILKTFKANRNETTLGYLAKALDNIVSFTPKVARGFAKPDMFNAVVAILPAQRSIYLKTVLMRLISGFITVAPSLKTSLQANRRNIDYFISPQFVTDPEYNLARIEALNLVFSESPPGFVADYTLIISRSLREAVAFCFAESEALRSQHMLYLAILLATDPKFFDLLLQTDRFVELVETTHEQLASSQSLANSSIMTAFYLLLDALKAHFEFVQSVFGRLLAVKRSTDPELAQELTVFSGVVLRVAQSSTLLKCLLDEAKALELLGTVDNVGLFFALDAESSLKTYVSILTKVIAAESTYEGQRGRVWELLLTRVEPALAETAASAVAEHQFDIIMSLIQNLPGLAEIPSYKLTELLAAIVRDFPSRKLSVKLGVMKAARFLLEKELLEDCQAVTSPFAMDLVKSVSKDPQTLINRNYFALLFYTQSQDYFNLPSLQQLRVFEQAIDFLEAFMRTNQLDEILSYLNIFLEILHKLEKNKQLQDTVVLSGSHMDRLIRNCSELYSLPGQTYLADLINVLYYAIRVVQAAQGSTSNSGNFNSGSGAQSVIIDGPAMPVASNPIFRTIGGSNRGRSSSEATSTLFQSQPPSKPTVVKSKVTLSPPLPLTAAHLSFIHQLPASSLPDASLKKIQKLVQVLRRLRTNN